MSDASRSVPPALEAPIESGHLAPSDLALYRDCCGRDRNHAVVFLCHGPASTRAEVRPSSLCARGDLGRGTV